MKLRHLFYLIIFCSSAAFAAEHVVIAPTCLSSHIDANILATINGKALLSLDNAGLDKLIAAKDVAKCGGFMDVTDDWDHASAKAKASASAAKRFLQAHLASVVVNNPVDYKIQHPKEVKKTLVEINPQNMWDNLTTLSNFQDRYADSDTGVKAQRWLENKIEEYAKQYDRKDVVYYDFGTRGYKQLSFVVQVGNAPGGTPGIVIGAHMDTLSGQYSKKPGADDDGSGVATVLEAVRTIFASHMEFKKPIYIAFYAAEEEGLIGSANIARYFRTNNLSVDAVLHFDLTGYAHQNEKTMYLITDNVDSKLTDYLGTLIKTYVKRPIKRTACGYACSDHASWTKNGYAASIPAESAYEDTNPNIHSTYDTMDKLSLEHMTDYAKLAVAFAVELAEPKN